jgi:8-oxo-dGTP pyrophosphatase MutT (NUDIX family)
MGRKKRKIRVLALAVIRRGDAILVAEGRDDVKQQAFYRPMGGGIEFGETGEQAAVREICEETGEVVTVLRYLGTLENIFTYNGQAGHEICRVYEAVFASEAAYQRETLEGTDDDEHLFTARWMPLDDFRRGAAPLYPDGLLDLLL